MQIKHDREMEGPAEQLLLEINDRVYWALNSLRDNHEIETIDIEVLKIDKESLSTDYRGSSFNYRVMANNLKKKIDFILKKVEN